MKILLFTGFVSISDEAKQTLAIIGVLLKNRYQLVVLKLVKYVAKLVG